VLLDVRTDDLDGGLDDVADEIDIGPNRDCQFTALDAGEVEVLAQQAQQVPDLRAMRSTTST